jgi:hypothetical protein
MAQIASALQKMGIAGGGLLSFAIVTVATAVTWMARRRRRTDASSVR